MTLIEKINNKKKTHRSGFTADYLSYYTPSAGEIYDQYLLLSNLSQ